MGLPRWKREQEERQKKKFAIAVRLVIILLLFSLLAAVGTFLVSQVRSSKLSPDTRVTLVFRTSPVLVASLDGQDELTILSIPEKTYVEVTHGFGSYRLGAVWDLGEQERMSGRLLAETSQELLAVPVDGWLGMKSGNLQIVSNKDEILKMKNGITSWGIFLKPQKVAEALKNLETNLTIFDLAKVWLRTKNVRFDKVRFLDLGETQALSPLVLADGSQAKMADQALLDTTTDGLFENTKIVNEQILIEVSNGGEKPGLATRVARLIGSLGGKVVSISNNPEKVDECLIRGNAKALESFTAGELKRVFNCRVVSGSSDSRADLQIIIGDNYWRKLFQKS